MAELFSGAGRGFGATLIGARVTPIAGFSVLGDAAGGCHGSGSVTTGAVLSAVGGGGGGGGGTFAGVDWTLLGAGWALLVGADPALGDGVGATLVGASVTGLRRTNRTPDTTPAKAPAATRAIIARLLRYHGRAAGLNVKVLLGEGSWP